MAGPVLAMHVFGQIYSIHLNVARHAKKAKSKAKSKAKLNIKKSKKGRRAAPPKRRKVAVSIPALEAAATKAADFAAKHEAAAAESKGAAEQRRSDADAARQEVTKLEAAAKKAARCRQECGCGQGGKQQGRKARRAC